MNLEEFDQLFVGAPAEIEANLSALLPVARASSNQSLYPQILSQIALAQAMQKRFTEAHEALDLAESVCEPNDHVARARILLERGRAYMQARDNAAASPFFLKSYQLCKKHRLDFHTCNAAHLVAMIAESTEDKIKWNAIAIELAERSPQAHKWLGALYNNLGHALLEAGRYEEALDALRQALAIREQEGLAVHVRVARWAVARAFRYLNRVDEALAILADLIADYEQMVRSGTLDLPPSALPSVRGLVFEELAEIYAIKRDVMRSAEIASLAYQDLIQDEWFRELYPERLEHLLQLKRQSYS